MYVINAGKRHYKGRFLSNKSSGKGSEKAWRGKLKTGMLYEIARAEYVMQFFEAGLNL